MLSALDIFACGNVFLCGCARAPFSAKSRAESRTESHVIFRAGIRKRGPKKVFKEILTGIAGCLVKIAFKGSTGPRTIFLPTCYI